MTSHFVYQNMATFAKENLLNNLHTIYCHQKFTKEKEKHWCIKQND
jgi:hypothetical protein